MRVNNKEANVALWPLCGQKSTYFPKESIIAINQLLNGINHFLLTNSIRDIRYIENHRKMIFIINSSPNTLYYQYFPNSNVKGENNYIIHKLITEAKEKQKKSEFDHVVFEKETRFLKLATSRAYGFALARKENTLSIYKFKFDFGVIQEPLIQNIDIGDTFIDEDDIEFDVIDESDNKTLIIILIKSKKVIKYGYFYELKKSIHLNDFSNITNLTLNPTSFRIYGDEDLPTISILESNEEHQFVRILQKKDNKKKKLFFKQLDNFVCPANDILQVNFYSINTEYLYVTPEDKEINLLIINSSDKIWTYDLETKIISDIIGYGTKDFYYEVNNKIPDLRKTKIYDLNFIVSINNNCLIFGNKDKEQIYGLISPKLRHLLYNLNRNAEQTYFNNDDMS